MTDPHQLIRSPESEAAPAKRDRNEARPLVPVTIVGGYLGAGKTTLINSLLAGDHGRRLAVLVNDFGSVNIDADLITAHDGQTISLENGCVCCSIADAMGDALDQVLALDPPPEQVIVEASGVADPAKVAIYGQGWPGCRLDALIVLADAAAIQASADDRFVGSLILRQLRAADVVVLTKTDLVSGTGLATTSSWIAGVAPTAEVISIGRIADLSRLLLAPRGADVGRPDTSASARAPDPTSAEDLFVSTVLTVGRPIHEHELRAALTALPPTVVRVKGFTQVISDQTTEPTTVTVHKVGDRVEIETAEATTGNTFRLVAISIRGDEHGTWLSPFATNAIWDVAG